MVEGCEEEDPAVLVVDALGELQVSLGDRRIESRIPDKAALLLVYLADLGEPVRRSTLAGLLWSDTTEERARGNLRVALSRLRSVIGSAVAGDRDRVWLEVEVEYDVAALARDTGLNADSVAERYRGPFLQSADFGGASLFDDWALARRQSLHATALIALTDAAESAFRAEDWTACRRHAGQVLRIEPWNEVAHRQVIAALARTKGIGAALAHYDRCVELLRTELGMEPAPETAALRDQIADGQIGRAGHRMRGAVGLPTALTPFIGREEERAVLDGRLVAGSRLVSLIGPGGVGKTRLAIEVLRSTSRFGDGVAFVDLTNARVAHDTLAVMAEALSHGAAQSLADDFERVVEIVGDREMCVVLDNFEQLVDTVTETIVRLLERCPNLSFVVTSRTPLGIAAEDRVVLSGLAFPPPDDPDPGAWPAVRLFIDRAYRSDKRLSVEPTELAEVALICRLLEGVPLYVELVAARLAGSDLATIRRHLIDDAAMPGDGLRDAATRHATFDAVFEQSWEMLSARDRQALAELSIMRGSFDTAAARALLESDGTEPSRLARASLLIEERHGRFRFHELLRQSAAARLPDADRGERLHARWYLSKVAEAEPGLVSGDAGADAAGLLPQLENVRVAWQRAVSAGFVDEIGAAATGIGYLFELSGRMLEAGELLGEAAEAFADGRLAATDEIDEAYLRRVQARQTSLITTDDMVEALCDRVHVLLAGREDRAMDLAWSELHRAQSAFYRGRVDDAARALERSEELAAGENNDELVAWQLLQRGRLRSAIGAFDEATDAYRQADRLFEDRGDVRARALAHSYLAPAFAEQNLVWEAYEADRTAMVLSERIGNRQRFADLSLNLGASLILLGDFEGARRHTAAALERFRLIGDRQIEGYVLAQHGECLIALGNTPQGERDFEEGIAISRSQGFAYGLLYNLVPWARHLLAAGRFVQAQAVAEELTEIATGRGARHFELTGHALSARTLAARGATAEAEALARTVRDALDDDGAPPLPWPIATLLDLATVLHEADPDATVELLRSAESIHAATVRSIEDPALRRAFVEEHPASVELSRLRAGPG